MSVFSSFKKIFLLGFIAIILVAIPFSVYIAQRNQNISSKADASTSLSFEPASATTTVGQEVTLQVVLDPKTGTATGLNPNQVSFVKLSINFDPAKLEFVGLTPSDDPNNKLTSVLEEPVSASGKATIAISIGADPANILTVKAKIAVLKLKAIAATNASPTSITFNTASGETQVLSIAPTDKTSENVNLLSTNIPANITINSSSSPNTTPTVTQIPTPTTNPFAPTPTSGQSGGRIGGLPGISLTPTLPVTPVVVTQIIPQPTTVIALPPTGPGENILGIGLIGTIFTIIGGALLIIL